jgi:hypothetical protein
MNWVVSGSWIREIRGDAFQKQLERQSRNQRLLEMPRKKAHGEHGKNLFRVLRAKFRGKKSLLLWERSDF